MMTISECHSIREILRQHGEEELWEFCKRHLVPVFYTTISKYTIIESIMHWMDEMGYDYEVARSMVDTPSSYGRG